MALKATTEAVGKMLEQIAKDLVKAARGNKAASQRVRTGTIKLEKIAKLYRKESVQDEKSGGGKKKSAPKKAAKKAAPKKAAKKAAPKKAAKKAAPKKAVKKAARPAARRRR